MDLKFDDFAKALPASGLGALPNSRLVIADPVDPFVAPTLDSSATTASERFAAEVVFIEAPAAVGKTTIAKFLSASRRLPLLDLATVPVATGSLKALIFDLADGALDKFHAAELPIVIDALDEGRMLSGEKAFEAFLETSGEFLLANRQVTNRPKLVVLGRPESVDLTRDGLALAGDVKSCSLRVGFFDQAAAVRMITAYADKAAKPASAYRKNPEPVRQLITAYFRAIESALGLEKDHLWNDAMGLAFAGYAPVLSAVGLLLADADNFKEIENKLGSEGTREAWTVIEDVLGAILTRERGKLCDKLKDKISVAVPPEAYDAHEQLTYITQHVHKLPLSGTSRVKFPAKDVPEYDKLVSQYVYEHPFVREGRFGNAVLASAVLSHAVVQDLLHGTDLGHLASFSNQPFLWRSVRKQLVDGNPLIDGRYLGYLLASFWTEPVPDGDKVVVRSAEDGVARVFLSLRGRETALANVTLPITFFGSMKNCDVDVDGAVEFHGQPRGSQSVFEVHASTLICGDLDVKADLLTIHEDVWVDSARVVSAPKLEVSVKDKARVGWGGVVGSQHPWKRYAPSLSHPRLRPAGDALTSLVIECSRRLPLALTFMTNWTVTDDNRMRWAAREFPEELPLLVKLAVEHQLASADLIPVNQVQVHLKFSWTELLAALYASEPPQALRAFVTAAREKIR